MADTIISIPVDTATAQTYVAMSPEAQRKVQVLLSLRVQEILSTPAGLLTDLIDEIGAKAEAQGLTPEILEELLRGK